MNLHNRHLILSIGVILFSILIVTLLTAIALDPTRNKNGFMRKYVEVELATQHVVEKPIDVADFAGFTSQSILFKTNSPKKLYSLSKDFKLRNYVDINVPDNSIIRSNYSFAVDFLDNIYLSAGNVPVVVKYSNTIKSNSYKIPCKSFIRSIPLSSTSFAFRGFDLSTKIADPVFFKVDLTSGIVTSKTNIIQSTNHDAGISTDGMFQYDPFNCLLFYINYYSNNIICLDTSLNVIYRSHTVDTFSVPQTFGSSVAGKNMVTNLSPKRLINASSSIGHDLLFVNSRVNADNDEIDSFNKLYIVDTYDEKTGIYKFSFHIPLYKNEKPKNFKIVDDTVFALYKSHLVSYKLPKEFLNTAMQ